VSDLTYTRHDGPAAAGLRELVADIARDAYGPRTGFGSDEAFMARFDAYITKHGFDLVLVHGPDGETIGQAWGWPLPPDTAWWNGLRLAEDPEPAFTAETGRLTFAVSEIMVRDAWTGQGIGRRLHDELLRPRTEQRATLLVRRTNLAYQTYARWGWREVGTLRPDLPDAPTFAVLVLGLATSRPSPVEPA
jgi:GNAT superfamily N-acetyltransferase